MVTNLIKYRFEKRFVINHGEKTTEWRQTLFKNTIYFNTSCLPKCIVFLNNICLHSVVFFTIHHGLYRNVFQSDVSINLLF